MNGQLRSQVVEQGVGPPSLVVVFLHGFGAPGGDLVPLGSELFKLCPPLAGRVRFVFPEAPLSLQELGMGEARAWWMLEPAHFAAIASGDLPQMLKMRHEVPEGLPRARRLLIGLVEELSRSTGLPYSRIVLGGFSQGAMLATDVALRLEEPPAGLVVLSGTLVNEGEWAKRAPNRAGLGVLLSHGRQDPLLPFQNALALRDLLAGAGLGVEFLPFEGGHTLSPAALSRVGAFLGARLPDR
ncbi:MAG: alpha/beta hydrolase [Myxococcaceae bacterium]